MSNNETASEVAQAEPLLVRTAEVESDIIRLVNEFPLDASEEAFAQELKKRYQSKKIRAACTQLGLHPQADPMMNHKDGYIKLLAAYRRAKQRGERFTGFPKTNQNGRVSKIDMGGGNKHCGFKLVNVILSPVFISRMVESGVLPSTGLQVEPVDGRSKYWRDVALAYTRGLNPEFFRLEGPPGRYEGIDPKLARHHSPAQLCSIWKDMTTKYEDSFARWTQLGTDNAGFAHFCKDLDVQYLHNRLQMQPIEVEVDPEQLRASKRARTGNVGEAALSGTDSEQEVEIVERGNFLTPREVEGPTQHQVPSAGGPQELTQQRGLMSSNEVQMPIHRQSSTASTVQDATQRLILPRSDAVNVSVPRQDVRTEVHVQEVPSRRQNSRVSNERVRQFIDMDPYGERRRVSAFDGVIYSSQAVRDTMAAIEALKRGRFDPSIISQAEESMNGIVQVWLRELDKARQPRTN